MNTPKIRFKGFKDDWEQRKFSERVTIERGGSPRPIDKFITNDENGLNWIKIGDAPEQGNYITQTAEKIRPEGLSKTREVHPGDLILSNSMSFGRPYIMAIDGCIHDGWLAIRDTEKNFDLKFLCTLLGTDGMLNQYKAMAAGSTVNNLNKELVGGTTVAFPMMEEQIKIGEYFTNLDHLITLHQRKCYELKKMKQYMANHMFVNQSIKCDRNTATNQKKLQERTKKMGELESVIEQRLIDQLCGGDSQWTYRKDIRTEEQLWDNFKYILEQNNKAKLNDMPLSLFFRLHNLPFHIVPVLVCNWLAPLLPFRYIGRN